jgi:CRISPR-associated protein Cas1
LPSEPEWPDPDTPIPLKPGTAPFLRTLYIQEQGSWLRIERERFIVSGGRDTRQEFLNIPARKIQQILVFGTCLITPAVMRYCLLHEITITLLSSKGTYFGKVETGPGGHTYRQRLQFDLSADPAFRLDLARRFIDAKLHNTRTLLRRAARRNDEIDLRKAAEQVNRIKQQLSGANSIDQLMGYEGHASAVYFGVLNTLLRGSDFIFQKRVKRPPTDPVNAMLSLGYTLLFNNLFTMVRLHRLHPYVGFLHADAPNHPTLVSDLMEEFRFLIERMVIRLCNRRIMKPDDFQYPEDQTRHGASACYLRDEPRKTFLRAFEQVMHREITHEASGRTVTYRQALDLQVRALAAHLEGTSEYLPFKSTS